MLDGRPAVLLPDCVHSAGQSPAPQIVWFGASIPVGKKIVLNKQDTFITLYDTLI